MAAQETVALFVRVQIPLATLNEPTTYVFACGEYVSCTSELTPQPAPKLSKRILGRLGKERIQKAENHPEVCEEDFARNLQTVYARDRYFSEGEKSSPCVDLKFEEGSK
jgi:hypothetical protein